MKGREASEARSLIRRFAPTGGGGGSVAWADVTGKPSTFTPSAHTHPASEISDFSEAVDDRVAALLAAGANITLTYDDVANTLTIAAASHSHAIADVTGLQAALDGKQETLVSGTNIKTINGTSILGGGDISVSGGSGSSPAAAWVI